MMSQTTECGAFVLIAVEFAWEIDVLYPAFIRAELWYSLKRLKLRRHESYQRASRGMLWQCIMLVSEAKE